MLLFHSLKNRRFNKNNLNYKYTIFNFRSSKSKNVKNILIRNEILKCTYNSQENVNYSNVRTYVLTLGSCNSLCLIGFENRIGTSLKVSQPPVTYVSTGHKRNSQKYIG